jgi:predicted deacetylase
VVTALGPAPRAPGRIHRALAVAIHDVEPATFQRCALMRDWLDDLGVERVTLLVIPGPQLHPFPARSPELANWLLDQVDAGDAVAQHGLQHRRTRPRPLRGTAAEYPGLDAEATIASVDAGRHVLTSAGLNPRGFVAPGYAYTSTLREHLATRYDWWATLLSLRGHARAGTPALCLGTSGPLKRAASPALVRTGAALSGRLLRLDLHPGDFDHPRHVLAVERVLRRAQGRVAVTYDDLCSPGFPRCRQG